MTIDDILASIFGPGGKQQPALRMSGGPEDAIRLSLDPTMPRPDSNPAAGGVLPRRAMAGAPKPAARPESNAGLSDLIGTDTRADDGIATFLAGMADGNGALLPAIGGGLRAQERAREAAAEKARSRAVVNQTYDYLVSKGVDPVEARTAIGNPAIAQEMLKRTMGLNATGSSVPRGYRQNATGLEPIPGGPADPATIAAQSKSRGRGRQFSVGDISKLADEGGKYQSLMLFKDGFNDKFAGYAPYTGDAALALGRIGWSGQDTADAATWWQEYDRYKNEVRNDLFGSALTATEKAAFEKADINPTMSPDAIKKNLEIQQGAIRRSIGKKARAMVKAGYGAEPIAEAYGITVDEIGALGKSDTAGADGDDEGLIEQARQAIEDGADPAAVQQRLRERGIEWEGE